MAKRPQETQSSCRVCGTALEAGKCPNDTCTAHDLTPTQTAEMTEEKVAVLRLVREGNIELRAKRRWPRPDHPPTARWQGTWDGPMEAVEELIELVEEALHFNRGQLAKNPALAKRAYGGVALHNVGQSLVKLKLLHHPLPPAHPTLAQAEEYLREMLRLLTERGTAERATPSPAAEDPPAVPDAEKPKGKTVGRAVRVPSGPFINKAGESCFGWKGQAVKKLGAKQMRLLEILWDMNKKRPREVVLIETILDRIWPKDSEADGKLKSLRRIVNGRLLMAKVGIEIIRPKGKGVMFLRATD